MQIQSLNKPDTNENLRLNYRSITRKKRAMLLMDFCKNVKLLADCSINGAVTGSQLSGLKILAFAPVALSGGASE